MQCPKVFLYLHTYLLGYKNKHTQQVLHTKQNSEKPTQNDQSEKERV